MTRSAEPAGGAGGRRYGAPHSTRTATFTLAASVGERFFHRTRHVSSDTGSDMVIATAWFAGSAAGMPAGSPGSEMGGAREPCDTVLPGAAGDAGVLASHRRPAGIQGRFFTTSAT